MYHPYKSSILRKKMTKRSVVAFVPMMNDCEEADKLKMIVTLSARKGSTVRELSYIIVRLGDSTALTWLLTAVSDDGFL